MPKPNQCKIIGGISIVLSAIVLVLSSYLLHCALKTCAYPPIETSKTVEDYDEFYGKSRSGHGGNPKYFESYQEIPSKNGNNNENVKRNVKGVDKNNNYVKGVNSNANNVENRQGNYINANNNKNTNDDVEGVSINTNNNEDVKVESDIKIKNEKYEDKFGYMHKSAMEREEEYLRENLKGQCGSKGLKIIGGIGITISIIQIFLSCSYCFATKKVVKPLSSFWAGCTLILLIILIALCGAALSLKSKVKDKKFLSCVYAFSGGGLGVSLLIFILIVFVGCTYKRSDYEDYSVTSTRDQAQELIPHQTTKFAS